MSNGRRVKLRAKTDLTEIAQHSTRLLIAGTQSCMTIPQDAVSLIHFHLKPFLYIMQEYPEVSAKYGGTLKML